MTGKFPAVGHPPPCKETCWEWLEDGVWRYVRKPCAVHRVENGRRVWRSPSKETK